MNSIIFWAIVGFILFMFGFDIHPVVFLGVGIVALFKAKKLIGWFYFKWRFYVFPKIKKILKLALWFIFRAVRLPLIALYKGIFGMYKFFKCCVYAFLTLTVRVPFNSLILIYLSLRGLIIMWRLINLNFLQWRLNRLESSILELEARLCVLQINDSDLEARDFSDKHNHFFKFWRDDE